MYVFSKSGWAQTAYLVLVLQLAVDERIQLAYQLTFWLCKMTNGRLDNFMKLGNLMSVEKGVSKFLSQTKST